MERKRWRQISGNCNLISTKYLYLFSCYWLYCNFGKAIVSPDGVIGFNYEHSAAEGPPILNLIDYCYPRLQVSSWSLNFMGSSITHAQSIMEKRVKFKSVNLFHGWIFTHSCKDMARCFSGIWKSILWVEFYPHLVVELICRKRLNSMEFKIANLSVLLGEFFYPQL